MQTELTGADYGWCLLTYSTQDGPKHPYSLAVALSSAMFAAAQLKTHWGFGCVQWRGRDA